jgi:colanic acid/amylovoran biosynthesis protein
LKTYLVDIYLANNLGDDMFLDHLAVSFPNVSFVPFYPGNGYDYFFKKYNNIKKFKYNFLDKLFSYFGVSNKLQNYDLMAEQFHGLIFLGGGIFREESYWKSVYEYRAEITNSFVKRNRTVKFIGCNFGSYYTSEFSKSYELLFSKCEVVRFRDLTSYSLFKTLISVSYAPDVLWSYNLPYTEKQVKTIGISIIDPNHKSGLEKYYQDYINNHQTLIQNYLNKGFRVKLFSFCKNEGDLKVCKEIATFAIDQVEIYNYTGNIPDFLSEFGTCSEIIAARFHAVIIAMKYKIPVLPIIYGDKTRNLLQDLKFKNQSIEFNELNSLKNHKFENYIFPPIEDFITNSHNHFMGI